MTRRSAARAAKEMEREGFPDWKLSYRVPEAAAATGLGESTVWKLLDAGKLAARKDGKATLIERAELQRYITSLPTREPALNKGKKP